MVGVGLLALNLAVGGVSGLVMANVAARSRLLSPILVLLGLTMTAGYAAMTLTGDLRLLVIFAAGSGLSGAYFPLLYSAAFQLRGVSADRIPVVAVAAIMTAVSLGTVVGPIARRIPSGGARRVAGAADDRERRGAGAAAGGRAHLPRPTGTAGAPGAARRGCRTLSPPDRAAGP